MRVDTKELFEHAYGKYAVGAYNVNNLEQIVGLFRGSLGILDPESDEGTRELSAPFIIQISKGARDYTDERFLMAIIEAAAKKYKDAVFAVHLDHGDKSTCEECIKSGLYDSVMIDASDKVFRKNVKTTKAIVDCAHEHSKHVRVEAELGQLGGVEEHISGSVRLTDPGEAKKFVERTKCDSLAVAIGTSHGIHKFSEGETLRFDHLKKIKEALREELRGKFPLVLHGAALVPPEWVLRVNKAGGSLANTSGVRIHQYALAVELGICKVNIDVDCRLIWTALHREFFLKSPGKIDLREPGRTFMQAYAEYVADTNRVLGAAGQAPKLKKAQEDTAAGEGA